MKEQLNIFYYSYSLKSNNRKKYKRNTLSDLLRTKNAPEGQTPKADLTEVLKNKENNGE